MVSILKKRTKKEHKEGNVTFKCTALGSDCGMSFYSMFLNGQCIAIKRTSPHVPQELSLESGKRYIPAGSEIIISLESVSYRNPVIEVV